MRSVILISLLAVPVASAGLAGVYVGAGSSAVYDEVGGCLAAGETVLSLTGPAGLEGTWGAEIDMVVDRDPSCVAATGWWRSPVDTLEGLVGSPESGFDASGVVAGVTPAGAGGEVAYLLHVDALGSQTRWWLHQQVTDPKGDVEVTLWRGSASFRGVHV